MLTPTVCSIVFAWVLVASSTCHFVRLSESDTNTVCPEDSISARDLTSLADNTWYLIDNAPIEVYSAYLDDRPWHNGHDSDLVRPENTVTLRTIAHGLQTSFAENNVPAIYGHIYNSEMQTWTHLGKVCQLNHGLPTVFFAFSRVCSLQAVYIPIYRSTVHADEYTTHFLLSYWTAHDLQQHQISHVGFGIEPCAITAAVRLQQKQQSATVSLSMLCNRMTATECALCRAHPSHHWLYACLHCMVACLLTFWLSSWSFSEFWASRRWHCTIMRSKPTHCELLSTITSDWTALSASKCSWCHGA